jgi:hypothetical protein
MVRVKTWGRNYQTSLAREFTSAQGLGKGALISSNDHPNRSTVTCQIFLGEILALGSGFDGAIRKFIIIRRVHGNRGVESQSPDFRFSFTKFLPFTP